MVGSGLENRQGVKPDRVRFSDTPPNKKEPNGSFIFVFLCDLLRDYVMPPLLNKVKVEGCK